MKKFIIEGFDSKRENFQKAVEAENQKEAIKKIQSEGLYVTSVKEVDIIQDNKEDEKIVKQKDESIKQVVSIITVIIERLEIIITLLFVFIGLLAGMHYIAVIIIAGVVYWLSEKAANLIRGYFAERAEEEARIDKENEIREFNEKTREQHLYVKKKYKNLNPEEIAVSKEIENERIPIEIDPDIYFENGNLIDELGIEYMTGEGIKQLLLTELHGYDYEEAEELIKTAQRAERREKLKSVKRKIKQKTQEEYGNIPSDSREPIPEEVKNQVWNRDGGKCVKCGSKEKLEFDHIIPISKGGANTARNIQLLCERCNREKSNNIG